ncbi:Cell fate regulator YaaT, PSP1 superfamily (controls sporulation, competence, biofilm development) [Neorhodopirellula lusitana]|uniref:Cell fate regulator YaaT, PSP1 superfamily (Controls sporulation, competence, biofilm development) n=1 Tax=Neorhodopirellula lusitana TaxID=445327 RepID=A0ABY1QFZ7_9BACT|nr:regulatory iron-sulfur-containing complex subunit RicT [Neorhodopirellula lusitana]SMP68432.1 Cell fate regulator YaaT, PSP1 superfamily (controls sporulation, competence, biofilm development) [Neorhodopirellula lusitana]
MSQPESSPRTDKPESGVPKGNAKDNDLQYVCRYGSMRLLGVMTAKESFRYGDEVVIRSDRGTEIATVLCEATPAAIGGLREPTEGRILRRLDSTDRGDWSQMSAMTRRDLDTCQPHVDRLKLSMQLIDVERVLGGERVVVYFVAEGRIDFRALVKHLGQEFQTRIEMRQIGIRDEAKLLADFGDCGQEVCCSRFLSKMPPVSMKMAKLQRASLDPTKISGRCGRLKCCLRYEFDTYESLAEDLPPIGSKVLTRDGKCHVVAQDILAGQLIVNTEDKRRIMIPAGDVVEVLVVGDGPTTGGKKRRKR